jgi:hypothetical protein
MNRQSLKQNILDWLETKSEVSYIGKMDKRYIVDLVLEYMEERGYLHFADKKPLRVYERITEKKF